jgi:hypothetical protein
VKNLPEIARNGHQLIVYGLCVGCGGRRLEQIKLLVTSLPFHEPQRLPSETRKGVGR